MQIISDDVVIYIGTGHIREEKGLHIGGMVAMACTLQKINFGLGGVWFHP